MQRILNINNNVRDIIDVIIIIKYIVSYTSKYIYNYC